MKRYILLSTILLFIVFATKAQEKKINTLSEKEKQEGWELLFDGKTLNGWHTYGKKDTVIGWRVIDGVLYNSGKGSDHGGDIVTDRKFKNFELYIEWRIDYQSNSGIFYHVNEEAEDAIYKTGPEYQLLDDKNWPDKLKAYQYTGANYAMNAPVGAEVKPLDQYNVTRIIVNGPHVEHWLNGVKVVEYELWTKEWEKNKMNGKWKDFPNYGIFKTGNIGLQDHGGLTRFRNIKIKVLPD